MKKNKRRKEEDENSVQDIEDLNDFLKQNKFISVARRENEMLNQMSKLTKLKSILDIIFK